MTETEVIEIAREAMIVILKIGGPIMLLGLAIGLVISVIQTLTQIQEMTLTFVPKIVIMFGALLLPFMLSVLVGFTHSVFDRIIALGP